MYLWRKDDYVSLKKKRFCISEGKTLLYFWWTLLYFRRKNAFVFLNEKRFVFLKENRFCILEGKQVIFLKKKLYVFLNEKRFCISERGYPITPCVAIAFLHKNYDSTIMWSYYNHAVSALQPKFSILHRSFLPKSRFKFMVILENPNQFGIFCHILQLSGKKIIESMRKIAIFREFFNFWKLLHKFWQLLYCFCSYYTKDYQR